jgi:hypothetical protein
MTERGGDLVLMRVAERGNGRSEMTNRVFQHRWETHEDVMIGSNADRIASVEVVIFDSTCDTLIGQSGLRSSDMFDHIDMATT